jgi:hypothetical protein
MIQAISESTTVKAAPEADQKASGKQTLCHTPFGDVMVDEMSTPNLAGLVSKTPGPGAAPPPAQAAALTPAPDAKSLFGDQPWMDTPGGTGPNGASWNFNPIYFATRETADRVAAMVGGTVVERNAILSAPGSPFLQSQPNEMIELPNGRVVYAGLIADFYNHGYPQSFIDRLLKSEIEGTSA